MRVRVGYSDNPDTAAAGAEAAREALAMPGQTGPCDMVLLFATARHDAQGLRRAVAAVVGDGARIVGGGAAGAICNDRFGYAGDQVVLAAIWLSGASCELIVEPGLEGSEMDVGRRLGERLLAIGTRADSPVLLFYDAIDSDNGEMRMVMATYLLEAIEKSLGFLPDINGAGLQGDFLLSPARQWIGESVGSHCALALAFKGEVRMDSAVMHGCRPATGYYTVTKADRQTILEINNVPALEFLDGVLGPAIKADDYPFFLILGVNQGEKWGEFDENSYASRLCLAIDRKRGGIRMFEPDMIAGTQFQIMYRSLSLDYIAPRIERLFENLGEREPVFAMYINCAGRAAGYGGMDLEDAVVIQNTVKNRAPLLGIYTGVEISSIQGRPRGLDWTGVFCLFSVPK